MLPSEILAQVRKIEIRTGRMVSELFAGSYRSVFKGRGIEFSEVREYVPGDDVRSIDWNVTARMGHPYIKRFEEEREISVMVACDLSGSLAFGSRARLKRRLAAEIGALLTFAALQNNDKVGFAACTEGVERLVPPRKGRRHALRLIRDLLAYEPERRGTDLGAALSTINRSLRRRGIVFLISDFQDPGAGFEHALRLASARHDVVPIQVGDPREEDLPDAGAFFEFEDPETGERRTVFAAGGLREAYRAERAGAARAVERAFRASRLESVRVSTDRPYAEELVRFFERRAKRFH